MNELNTIALPPITVAGLYESTLVLPGSAKQAPLNREMPGNAGPAAELVSGTIRSLGNNQQQILLLVRYPDTVFLPDSALDFLTGVLTACKLSMADVALVNLHPAALDYKILTQQFSSRICILFGISPAEIGLPMNFPHYQLQPFATNTFLYTPALDDMEQDKVEKSKLWVCLKRLFNI